MAKYWQKKISGILTLAIIIAIVIAVLVYFLTKSIPVTVIVSIIALIIVLIINKSLNKGETYQSFYKRTMYKIIFKVLEGFNIEFKNVNVLTKDELQKNIKTHFDKMSSSERKTFTSDFCAGELFNLKLKQEYQVKSKDGSTRTETKEVFDGFYLTINYKKSFDFLKGASINIRADESLLSSLTEDTVNSIYQSDKYFEFNSEELNKALDCHIRGTNAFGDIDDLMMQINKIITPTFEEYLLFLKERYNAFNMTITDSSINFNVNMDKNLFQTIKGGNLLNFSAKYKDYTKSVELPTPTLSDAKDFMYSETFPVMEQLFLIKYLDNLMHSGLDRENFAEDNINNINLYQQKDLELAETEMKEFVKIQKEEIEALFESSKDLRN